MGNYVYHEPAIGGSAVNKDAACLILRALSGKDKFTFQDGDLNISLTRNHIGGSMPGSVDHRRYNPSGRNYSYSLEVSGYNNESYPENTGFNVTMAIVNQNGIPLGGNVIKVHAPFYRRNPYSKTVIGTDDEKSVDVYDIKRGGDTEFITTLINDLLDRLERALSQIKPSPAVDL